jgi:hypothetical protein
MGALATEAHSESAGFAFLEIPAGARASAMGGAFTSVAEDVEAIFWNPAGLAGVKGLQVAGSHYELINGLRAGQFAVAGNVAGGGLSGSVRALYTESIPERDQLGNLIGGFGAHDLEFALGYGAPLGGGFDLGLTAQVVRERIADVAATTYAFGGGMTWAPPPIPRMRMSGSLHNLGPETHYVIDGSQGAPVALPFAGQVGVSYVQPIGNLALRGALEGRLTRGRTGIAIVGGELVGPGGAALRAGYRANDDAQQVSFGAGYTIDALRLDYAWVPLRYELGDTHRFAFSAQF